jgi:hypothetical protein
MGLGKLSASSQNSLAIMQHLDSNTAQIVVVQIQNILSIQLLGGKEGGVLSQAHGQ